MHVIVKLRYSSDYNGFDANFKRVVYINYFTLNIGFIG